MKKVTYLVVLMFALVTVFTSCQKSDDDLIVPQKTLEQQYPDWKNLSWISTTKNYDNVNYPQLNFKIVGNLVSASISEYYPENDTVYVIVNTFDEVTLTSTTINFHSTVNNNNDLIFDYKQVGDTFVLTTIPNPLNFVYIVKIN